MMEMSQNGNKLMGMSQNGKIVEFPKMLEFSKNRKMLGISKNGKILKLSKNSINAGNV